MFKIGQKVVCKKIEGFATSAPHGIKLGEIYTIMQIGTCVCGQEVLYLKEAPVMKRWCGTKDVYTGTHASFYSYRFEPLVGSWVEELLERLKSEVEAEECVSA
jgi:hypothetical protein